MLESDSGLVLYVREGCHLCDQFLMELSLELGPIVDGLRVVRSGLAPTDRIVIDGIQRARPGQKVTAEDGKIEAAAK